MCEKETERANTRQSTFRSPPVQTWKLFVVFKLNFDCSLNFSDCRTWLFFEPDYSKPKLSGEQSSRRSKTVTKGVLDTNRCIDLFRVRMSRRGLKTVGWPWLKQWFIGFAPAKPWKWAENVDKSCPVQKFDWTSEKASKTFIVQKE